MSRRGTAGDFIWERPFEKRWEGIEEDESGLLKLDSHGGVSRLARALPNAPLQRGLLRSLLIVLDCSHSSEQTDLRPSRAEVMHEKVAGFISAFFDANPLSFLGLVRCRKGVAETVSSISGSPSLHIECLASSMKRCSCSKMSICTCGQRGEGDFSFENSLQHCLGLLYLQPEVVSREVLVVMSALSTVDPGDLLSVTRQCVSQMVRVSTIAISGEVFVATRIAEETGGSVGTPESEGHLGELLMAHCLPPARTPAEAAAAKRAGMLAPVGFPELVCQRQAICSCHSKLVCESYICPRCKSHLCSVPAECPVCALRLIDSSAVASSYHHIYPATPFLPLPNESESSIENKETPQKRCSGCAKFLDSATGGSFFCPRCSLPFCSTCDTTIHESLFSCPGCPSTL